MKFKLRLDWDKYLHTSRNREFKITFSSFPQKVFPNGLEIGAGDGYQTKLMLEYVKELTSLEYNFERFNKSNLRKRVKLVKGDAEELDKYFRKKEFSIIFSSFVLEHIKDRKKCLNGVYKCLKDNGITINLVPSRFAKFNYFVFHYFNLVYLLLENFSPKKLNAFFKKVKTKNKFEKRENNLKSNRKYNLLRKIFWPFPHGEYTSNFNEFLNYSKRNWIKQFNKSRFEVIKVLKAPAVSGYGFGWNFLRRLAEIFGLSSGHIIFAIKKGKKSIYAKYIKNLK